jgi:hypothetical protein
MSRNRTMALMRCSMVLLVLVAVLNVAAYAQDPTSPTLPTKEQKLDAKGLAAVFSAKTVAVVATALPFIEFDRNGKPTQVIYRGGRTGPDKAKADVEKVLSEWGAFTVVNDPARADLVLVIEEQTLAPSFRSDNRPRLKDTLAVFLPGGTDGAWAGPPLWVGITTEGAIAAGFMGALKTPDAQGVVEKFRRDVVDARKRVNK